MEDVSVAETMLNAKLLIRRLPSFSVPNITSVHTSDQVKHVALNMADPIGIKYTIGKMGLFSQSGGNSLLELLVYLSFNFEANLALTCTQPRLFP